MFNKSILIFLWLTTLIGCSLAIHLNLGQLFGAKKIENERNLRVDQIEFDSFIKRFNRVYLNETEKQFRFEVFRKNLKKIDLLNDNEEGTAFYGVTKWADLTYEEFSTYATGLRPNLKVPHNSLYQEPVWNRDAPLPESWDWRDHGAVTEVKDQGMCGSCWAFSTTGNIEGVKKVVDGTLYDLSEEQLVECDTIDHGCDGGYMTNAYQSIEKMGGLETEDEYPYKGLFYKTCHMNDTAFKVNIDSYVTLPTNETQIAQYVVQNGPVSIGLNAFVMQFYIRGISHPPHWLCSPKKIDHGVLIVGHGVATKRSKQIPFWIVKNSWGRDWGRQGYYYVYRGDGTCGLNTMVSSAVIN